MALLLVVTTDGEGYYLTDGDAESEVESWGVPVDFDGKRYLGELDDDSETTTLSIVTECAAGSYEEAEQADPDDSEEESEDEEETVETE